jgi:hypothetical protein
VIGVFPGENGDRTLSPDGINPLPCRVEENVVTVADGAQRLNDFPAAGIHQ